MTETFDEKRRASLKQFARDRAQAASETTPTEISTAATEFARELGGGVPRFVPVSTDACGLYGWCSDGVLEKVKRDGGQIVFGWTIWEWPEVMLTAEFHAIWSGTNGKLIDITPKPQGETSILFVADGSYAPDFDFSHRPTNRRKNIAVEPDYSRLAAVTIAGMKPSQIKYEAGRATKKGVSLVEWIAERQAKDRFPSLVDRLIDICHQYEVHLDFLNPGGGAFEPDRKFFDLERQKIALLTELKIAKKHRRKDHG